jgi:hypothetical protein
MAVHGAVSLWSSFISASWGLLALHGVEVVVGLEAVFIGTRMVRSRRERFE